MIETLPPYNPHKEKEKDANNVKRHRSWYAFIRENRLGKKIALLLEWTGKLSMLYPQYRIAGGVISGLGAGLRKWLNKHKYESEDTMESGIKETKDVLEFGAGVASLAINNLQDGFQITDLAAVIPPLTKLPSAIDGITEVDEELADMDPAEEAELLAVFNTLDIPDEKKKALVKQGVKAGLALGQLILMFRTAKEEPTVN